MSSLKNKFRLFSLSLLMILGVVSCTNERVERDDRVQVVEKQIDNSFTDFPFSDKEELKLMSGDGVNDFELIRGVSTLELGATGMAADMNWIGCRLSELPITIYDLESRPRYYDFIVYNGNNNPIGTVRTYAQKEKSTVIEGVYRRVTDYRALLTKGTDSTSDLFIDWKGTMYVGEKSQAGEKPRNVTDMQGNQIPNSQLLELRGLQIVDYLTENIFPDLILSEEQREEIYAGMPEELRQNPELRESVLRHVTLDVLKDSMILSWERTEREASAFWEILSAQGDAIVNLNTSLISNEPEGFFKKWFPPIEKHPYWIERYDWKKNKYRRGGWCGPWACGFIVYVRQGRDKYNFFESCAATFGEFGVGNIVLKIFGKPLTPYEMAWSMPIASGQKIWVEPTLRFRDRVAYDHIRHSDRPTLRLCASGSALHWTLAYGTRQTGNRFWRNYYFLQIDNGSKIGVPGSVRDWGNYKSVDWWNPWLKVWD